MIPDACGSPGRGIGRLDLDVSRTLGHHRACHLHRQAEFAGLILADLDDQPAVGRGVNTRDMDDRVRQAGNIERKVSLGSLVQNRTV